MKLPNFRKGQIAVVMTLAIAALLGAMALSTDVAVMYYNWMQLQKAADASALAGATYFLTQNTTQTLPAPSINGACTYPTQQQNVACTYALSNFAQQADMTQGGIYIPAQSIPGSVPAGAQTIQVTLKRTNIPVFFMRVLGRSGLYSATATSIAVAPTPVSSIQNGLFPDRNAGDSEYAGVDLRKHLLHDRQLRPRQLGMVEHSHWLDRFAGSLE
jgi:uncharacterized membrane protein